MVIAQCPERRKSTNNDSSAARNVAYRTGEKTQKRSSDSQNVSREDQGDGFTSLRAAIERSCRLASNVQERRKIRRELWNLSRTDEERFKAITGNGPDDALGTSEGPQRPKNGAEVHVYTQPTPPCLQCSLKDGRICSIQLGNGYERAVRCQRCRLDGETYCIRQHSQLIRPPNAPADDDDDDDRVDLGRAESEQGYLTSRVYSQDNILQRDKPRLRAIALALLRRYAYRVVARSPTTTPTKTMVLPMWHANDHSPNRGDPAYSPRTHGDYFRECRARRVRRGFAS